MEVVALGCRGLGCCGRRAAVRPRRAGQWLDGVLVEGDALSVSYFDAGCRVRGFVKLGVWGGGKGLPAGDAALEGSVGGNGP